MVVEHDVLHPFEALAPRYPRWAEFTAIRERLDPEGRFVNAWIERTLRAAVGV